MPDSTDNRVLGQLMLLQGTLGSMPTDESISRFVSRGLKSVPGVSSLKVCVRGAIAEKNDLCPSCNYRWGKDENKLDYLCKLEDDGNTKCLPIRTADHLYGFVIFSLNNTPDAFTPYEPYLYNIVNVIAILIDNRRQKQVLEAFNKQLQGEMEYRKRAEEKRKLSEERLIEAQAVAKVGSWETELLTLKVIWSEETYRIFEIDPDSFQSSHPSFLEFVHPEDRAKVDAAFIGSMDKHSPNTIEHRIVTPGGLVKFIEERWHIFYDNQGIPVRAVGTCQDITERKQAEEKIQASLHEKETMLKEIHHRVKNNLQVISSLLNMQSSYLQDEKAKEIFQNSMDRVSTMAKIHTLLYQSEDLTRIDFDGFIRDLAGRLQQAYGIAGSPVGIHVNASDVSLTIETSIPCGLILNELLSNAFKYAFPGRRGGEIHISMATAGDQFVLKVQDNGIGFPEAVDFQNTKSLGLELVNLLVGQMNGAITLTVEGGTTFTIMFPAVSNGG